MTSPAKTDDQKPVDKAAAWHRMNREVRLEEFNARREALRTEFKESGMKRKEANHKAWQQAIEEYPPLPVEEDEEEAEAPNHPWDDDDLEHRLPPPRPYNGSDTLWAYEYFVRKSTMEDDAPNRGAWGLLQWGGSNPTAFYSLVAKAMKIHDEKVVEEKRPTTDMTVQERTKMFEDFMARYRAERRRRGLKDGELLNA